MSEVLARDDADFGDHVQDALKAVLDGLADDADAPVGTWRCWRANSS